MEAPNYLEKKIMGKDPRNRPDDKAQSKLFIQNAREIDADEESSAADELLAHLRKKPPEPRVTRPKKRES